MVRHFFARSRRSLFVKRRQAISISSLTGKSPSGSGSSSGPVGLSVAHRTINFLTVVRVTPSCSAACVILPSQSLSVCQRRAGVHHDAKSVFTPAMNNWLYTFSAIRRSIVAAGIPAISASSATIALSAGSSEPRRFPSSASVGSGGGVAPAADAAPADENSTPRLTPPRAGVKPWLA